MPRGPYSRSVPAPGVDDMQTTWQQRPPRLSLLCVTDAAATISVFTDGLQLIAHVDGGAPLKDAVSTASIHIRPDILEARLLLQRLHQHIGSLTSTRPTRQNLSKRNLIHST